MLGPRPRPGPAQGTALAVVWSTLPHVLAFLNPEWQRGLTRCRDSSGIDAKASLDPPSASIQASQCY